MLNFDGCRGRTTYWHLNARPVFEFRFLPDREYTDSSDGPAFVERRLFLLTRQLHSSPPVARRRRHVAVPHCELCALSSVAVFCLSPVRANAAEPTRASTVELQQPRTSELSQPLMQEGETRATPSAEGELSLACLIDEVRSRNPSLQAMAAAWQSAAQRFPQAVSLEDPMFMAMMAPASFDSDSVNPGYTLQGSQKFPWFGKRAARGRKHKQNRKPPITILKIVEIAWTRSLARLSISTIWPAAIST